MIDMAVGAETIERAFENDEQHGELSREFAPSNHVSKDK